MERHPRRHHAARICSRLPRSFLDERIRTILAEAAQPRAFADIRAHCRTRTATLYQRLAALTATGAIVKTAEGYSLAAT